MATDVLDRPAVKAGKGKKPDGTVQVEAGKLAKALKVLAALVEKRNTIPVLSCVRIVVKRDAIHLTGTDLDIWASDQVPVNCHSSEIVPFTACVGAHKLYEAVNSLPASANVTLTREVNRLRVEGESLFGNVCWRFPSLAHEDFPDATGFEPVSEFEIPAFALAQGFDAVRQAISTEETRYYLNGIFAHVVEDIFYLAATDGHRLARHVLARGDAMPEGAATMPDSIIARRTVNLIAQVIDNLDGKAADETDIDVKVGTGKIGMTIGTVELVAKLIDGTFPDYTRLIPTANDKVATVKPSHLSAAIRQVMLVSGEKTRAIKCVFDRSGLEVNCAGPEYGDGSARMGMDYHADPLTIGYNARYLLDILGHMGGEEMTVAMADPAAPTVIQSHEGASTVYVLMPMRVL